MIPIVINLAAGVLGFLFSLTTCYVVWRFWFSTSRRPLDQSKYSSHNSVVPVPSFENPIGKMNLADLMAATAGFHSDNVMIAGSASIGISYKAVLPNGLTFTVKRLHDHLFWENQFQADITRIGQIRHLNLVPLLCYCIERGERLLIYENMANGALSSRLQSENLDWPTRLRIGIGVARGLAWLHHSFPVPFLHQNLSSSVVLLDEDYEPKITDFGLARLLRRSSPSSTKGDVYEFGVILLELATGKVSNNENLAQRVIQLCVNGRILEAADESLRGEGHEEQIVRFLNVACLCVVDRPEERPSMYEVYRSLKMIGGGHRISEQFDESLLYIYEKDKPETAEWVKMAYCIYTGRNPFL